MNEVTKSFLWRVNDMANKIAIGTSSNDELEISEEDFRSILQDITKWTKTYPLRIDGILLKVKWNG